MEPEKSFEALLVNQSTALLGTRTEHFEDHLKVIALETLKWFDIDRAALTPATTDIIKDKKLLSIETQGVTSVFESTSGVAISPYLKYVTSNKLAITFKETELANSNIEAFRVLHQQGVKWHAIIPLQIFGKKWGAFTLSRFHEGTPLPAHQLVRLKLLGEMYASYWQYAVLSRNVAVKTDVQSQPTESALSKLSLRQKEVLSLLAAGLKAKEVGEKLFLSSRTVESHKYKIMEILGVDTNTQLVQFAVSNGLIVG